MQIKSAMRQALYSLFYVNVIDILSISA